MFPSFRIGTIFGLPIRANLTFLLLLVFVAIWQGGAFGVALALLAFGSVLLHELGHALMARHLRVGVSSIDLHFFGGAANMTDLPRTPGDEIAIAAAGPAVSFGLAGLGLGLGLGTGVSLLTWLGTINLILGVFNLLPAFPSDGGRILRALLAPRRGLVGATDLAVKVARVVCVALLGAALYYQSWQLAIVAVLLWMMGSAERLAVRMRGGWDDWRAGPPRVQPVEYIPPPKQQRPPRVVVWRF
jgi:Zn-dependent protease